MAKQLESKVAARKPYFVQHDRASIMCQKLYAEPEGLSFPQDKHQGFALMDCSTLTRLDWNVAFQDRLFPPILSGTSTTSVFRLDICGDNACYWQRDCWKADGGYILA